MPKLSQFHSCLLECIVMKPPNPPPPPPPPPTTQETAPMPIAGDVGGDHRRKRRSKLARMSDPTRILQPKAMKKPDPLAAKITRPCTECGKRFWSWKALFGHMRCHPERQWRGINPPPNFRRPFSCDGPSTSSLDELTAMEHEVAACLVMLANGPSAGDCRCFWADHDMPSSGVFAGVSSGTADIDMADSDLSNSRFECSSCKRVFGSHQALGGHRATHKNVKGCFASASNADGEVGNGSGNAGSGDAVVDDGNDDERVEGRTGVVVGHRCSICMKVFLSGQALGGHKRCHFERMDERGMICSSATKGCVLDLNLPAPTEAEGSSSDLVLDLKLGF